MAGNYQHLIEIIFAAKNAGATAVEIERVFSAIKGAKTPITDTTKKMSDFEKALRRVAIVAPVWMVARTAMMSFLSGFSEGFKYMEEFNAAMLKAQAVTQGVTGTMGEAMTDLAGRIRNLSQETGESMTKIANAFYQFGTIGIDFETSWKGAEAATRFALATQEDSAKVAKTLAMTYKILGDTIDKTIPSEQALEVENAKLYKLWQLNAGEAGDLTASLAAFLPTANTMNLSMDETIALLSTLNSAAMLGSRGGTLLRTSFSKLIDNSDKLASSLGIYVNPQLDSTFDVMMKVLGATKQLYEAQQFPTAAQGVISDIFGGVRGGEPVKALIALYDQLQENLSISTKKYSEQTDTMKDYQKGIDLMVNSVSGQLKIFRELRTQLFEQFITGVTGADEFSVGLQKINAIMKKLSSTALTVGETIHNWDFIPIVAAVHGLTDGKPTAKKPIDNTKEMEAAQDRLGKIVSDWADKNINKKNKEFNINSNLLRQLDLQKRDIQEQIAIQKLVNEGYSESDILIAEIANEVSKIVDQYNSLDAVQNRIVPQLNKQEILSNVLAENWEKILQTTNQQPFVQEKLLGLAKQVNQMELQKTQILQKQQEQYTDIYSKYEQADMFERAKLRRMLELKNMNPQELVQSFENSAYDKNLIMEYWSTFSQEGQNAIGKIIEKLYDLPEAKINAILTPYGTLNQMSRINTMTPQEQMNPITSITNIGAQSMSIKVDLNGIPNMEEMAELLAEEVKKGVLNDATFQDAWGRIYNIKREK